MKCMYCCYLYIWALPYQENDGHIINISNGNSIYHVNYASMLSLWLVTRTPLNFVDPGCSYLAQLLLMACRLQITFYITAKPQESKIN